MEVQARWRVVTQEAATLEPVCATSCRSPEEVRDNFVAQIQDTRKRKQSWIVSVLREPTHPLVNLATWNSNNDYFTVWEAEGVEDSLWPALTEVEKATGLHLDPSFTSDEKRITATAEDPTLSWISLKLIASDYRTSKRMEETISAAPAVVEAHLLDYIRRYRGKGLNQTITVFEQRGSLESVLALWNSNNVSIDLDQGLGDTPLHHLLIRVAKAARLRITRCKFVQNTEAGAEPLSETNTPVPDAFREYFGTEQAGKDESELGVGRQVNEETLDEQFVHYLRQRPGTSTNGEEIGLL
jgi:hypothetical protein